jgi:ABC-type transporter Mla subunit MlaD
MGVHSPSFGEVAEKASKIMTQLQRELDDFSGTLKNVADASENVRAITIKVRGSVDRNEHHVDEILEHANKTTRNAEELTRELKPEMLAAVKDVRETVAEAKAKVQEVFPKVTQIVDKLNDAASNVKTASANVRDASVDAKATTAEARQVVVGNRANIDGAIEEIRQSAARLNLAMEDIRRNPWKLLNRNIEADAYTQNIYDASMSFAEGARALSQSSATLQALLAKSDADPEQLKETTDKINELVGEMTKLEALLYEALKNRPR